MSFIDHLFQFEFFAAPVWKMAEKAINSKDLQTFEKRWPMWSKRLEYFPHLKAELFSEMFKEENVKKFEPFQKQTLSIFFENSTINSHDSFVASTLSRLCLAHNWDALNEIEKYISFNGETRTIIACAMLHEANDKFWDTVLPRSRITLEDALNYIHDATLPYSGVNDLWEKSLFHSKTEVSEISTFGFHMAINHDISVLPNFNRDSLWEYAMITVSDPVFVQKITEYYPLPADQLAPMFNRQHPLNSDFVYDLIQKNMPLGETLNSLLIEPLQTGINFNNIVEVVKETTPAIAPAFEEAVEQYLNGKQRDKLLKNVETTSHHYVRRKM